jgi:hypothetical protein
VLRRAWVGRKCRVRGYASCAGGCLFPGVGGMSCRANEEQRNNEQQNNVRRAPHVQPLSLLLWGSSIELDPYRERRVPPRHDRAFTARAHLEAAAHTLGQRVETGDRGERFAVCRRIGVERTGRDGVEAARHRPPDLGSTAQCIPPRYAVTSLLQFHQPPVSQPEAANLRLLAIRGHRIGTPTVPYAGPAVALGRGYPRWLGWVATAAGAGALVTGTTLFLGVNLMPFPLLYGGFVIPLTIWLTVMGLLMWRRARITSVHG